MLYCTYQSVLLRVDGASRRYPLPDDTHTVPLNSTRVMMRVLKRHRTHVLVSTTTLIRSLQQQLVVPDGIDDKVPATTNCCLLYTLMCTKMFGPPRV